MVEVFDVRPGCSICEIIPRIDPEFVLAETEHWVANLRENDQTLLGTSFITLKRHAAELDELTSVEESEFVVLRNAIIRTTRSAFAPKTFNISCLKNDAFKTSPDGTSSDAAHIHYHVKPRYGTGSVEFAGTQFTDPLPGRYLSTFDRTPVTRNVATQIATAIRSNLALSQSQPVLN